MSKATLGRKKRGRAWAWLKPVRTVLSLVPMHQRVLVIGGLFISSICEFIGLTMIVPLLAIAGDFREGKTGLITTIRAAMESIGLAFEPHVILVLIVAGLTLKAVITISVMRYVGALVSRITSSFQMQLMQALLAAEWRFFIYQPLGRLTHAAGPEASAVGESFHIIANIFSSFLQAMLFLSIAIFISWQMALLVVFIGILMFLSFGHLVRQRRLAARQHRSHLRQMAANFTDAVIGIKPLRAMGRTERLSGLFASDTETLSASWRRRVLSDEYVSELQEPVIGCMVAIGFYIAATRLSVAPHELLIIALLFVRIIATLVPVQRMISSFLQSYDLFCSLRGLLRETRAAAEVSSGTRVPSLQRAITFENLTFAYASKPVLSDVTLVIPAGQITTLAGLSGVGKSTMADLILGLYRPQAGAVRIDGTDLRDVDLAKWRKSLGYVPQEVSLFHSTILKNVTLWDDDVDEAEVIRALKQAAAWSFVEQLPEGMNYVVGERGNRLSGGQRQRISIARAVLHNPSLLILDEATTGLDPHTEQEICEAVTRLTRETGMTVLAISHQSAWREVADVVYWIESGGSARYADRGNPVSEAIGR